jgi:hypothetical protein
MRLRSLENIALGNKMSPSTRARDIAPNALSRSSGPFASRRWSCTLAARAADSVSANKLLSVASLGLPGCESTARRAATVHYSIT